MTSHVYIAPQCADDVKIICSTDRKHQQTAPLQQLSDLPLERVKYVITLLNQHVFLINLLGNDSNTTMGKPKCLTYEKKSFKTNKFNEIIDVRRQANAGINMDHMYYRYGSRQRV